MIEKPEWLWRDGGMISWNEAGVDLLTHSLHYGFGVFEGIRAYRQRDGSVGLFRLPEHIERLYRSAAILGLEVPCGHGELASACADVVRSNELSEAYIRPLVYVGEPNIIFAHWLNQVHVAVMAFAWSGYSDRSRADGTPATISPYVRPKVHAELFKSKACGHYLLSNLAFADAVRRGYKQALFVDEDDVVCEGTGENVFVVAGERIATTPLDRAVLGGLTRASVMELARGLGYEVEERDLRVEDLRAADEVFTAGTASELMPVPSLDGEPIGTGRLGPVTRALQTRLEEVVRGERPEFAHWITRA